MSGVMIKIGLRIGNDDGVLKVGTEMGVSLDLRGQRFVPVISDMSPRHGQDLG